VSSGLDRVREAARRDKDARFSALLHHVNLSRLEAAYWALRPGAAPGVDGVTWHDFGRDLEENLRDLRERVHSGVYRASPNRRVYIEKAERLRTLGIATLEDKILQRCDVEVLNAIYEDGLSRPFLRVPTRAQPASRVGCAQRGDPTEEGELGARRGHRGLFFQS
jgi:hypothetical protein